MGVYTPGLLSSSTNGKPIPVVATSTPGTSIHTAGTGTTGFDEVYLFASNITDDTATLTIEWGGTTDPGDHLVRSWSIPPNSPPYPVAVGQRIQNGLSIKAYSGVSGAVNITGWINRRDA